jgi:hypothetical protein
MRLAEIKLIVSRFLDAKAKSNISGSWVAESKYKFNVAPNEKNKNEVVLQVWAKLNMDFSDGNAKLVKGCSIKLFQQ